MKTKPKKFDAVLESRRWKESVVRRTAGMSRAEVLEFFNSVQTVASRTHEPTGQTCVVREEPANE